MQEPSIQLNNQGIVGQGVGGWVLDQILWVPLLFLDLFLWTQDHILFLSSQDQGRVVAEGGLT